MYYWRPYVSVGERRRKGERAADNMRKEGKKVFPIKLEGRAIAETFWGKAWCSHLESFSDYENRLPRGRSYVRNGSVIHLDVNPGRINALVQGSSLYRVNIAIKPLQPGKWKHISERCSGRIESMIELLQGTFSSGVMRIITDQEGGLFPLPGEISLNCSCPDWVDMCKHVAAVLYGVGHRLDHEPELLFKLRKVNHMDLMQKAKFTVPASRPRGSKAIEDRDLSNIFGIDIASGKRSKPAPRKAAKRFRGKGSGRAA